MKGAKGLYNEAKTTGDAVRARQAAQAQASNLKTNFSTDLSNENLATVVAGGGAKSADSVIAEQASRKRRGTGGLASQLGIMP